MDDRLSANTAAVDDTALPVEARVLRGLGEPLAAGLYELRNASPSRRWGRALKRYAESVQALPAEDGPLYPAGRCDLWRLDGAAVGFSYTFSLALDARRLREKVEALPDGREQQVARSLVGDLENMGGNPLSGRYSVGGRGYTHSILNYARLLGEGLPAYGRRIAQGLAAATDDGTRDFYLATGEALQAVRCLLRRAVEAVAPGPLREALRAADERPPSTLQEALVLLNFMYYVDGCDSVGALDRYLSPFFRGDAAEAEALLAAFFANVEANTGWHVILGGEGADEAVTLACLRAQCTRRPNTGLKVTADTSRAIWDAAFDSLRRGTGNPSFYHDAVYRAGATRLGIAREDLPFIAYGGCTEFMVEGRSNVGSIDAGINLLQVLEGTIQTELADCESFAAFLERFQADVRRQVEILVAELAVNQQYKAVYRPQLLRTLFIDDCLDRALEYNAGGARYNGGVVNVAGIANTANSLLAIRAALDGSLGIDGPQLLAALRADLADEGLRRRLLALPKFGNDAPEVDELARQVVDFTFAEIARHRGSRADGFLIPSCIMFTTYAQEGRDLDATPDGRRAGSPIADCCGPMQGTDTEGPTAMLTSTARLPLGDGLGTMILNLRVNPELLAAPEMRDKLRALLEAYFALGGMQVQVTAVDAEVLRDAVDHPEAHENLIVRIGGFTEYFNRLDPQLKQEVIRRTEHL